MLKLFFWRKFSSGQRALQTWFRRGHAHVSIGQWHAALDCYREVVRLDPNHAEAHVFLGNVLVQLHAIDQALGAYDAAIGIAPDHAIAHAGRGLMLMALGQPGDAVESYKVSIRLEPGSARAFAGLAKAQETLGRLMEARESHARAAMLDPLDGIIHFNRGNFLSDLKDWEGAAESLRAALAAKPAWAEAYCNLGLALQESGQSEAALDSYSSALSINPTLTTVFNNRGNLLRSKGQIEKALSDYRQALALQPDSPDIHYAIGQLTLLQGDLAAGWPQYEWRHLTEEALAIKIRNLPHPAWFGDHPLQDKRIFLHAEQGLGDTIQFCRYVPMVANLGAHVTLEVQPSLRGLLADLDGVSEFTSQGAPLPSADYQCSLMSLPGAFKTTLATIPHRVPYLHADSAQVERWREILGPRKRPRVGLAWSGNPRNRNDPHRSIEFVQLIKHLPDGCEYLCLQKDIRDADRLLLSSSAMFTVVESHNQNFTDTAALIATLDLVISVDTSLAHLSGAMGQKTWILLPFSPDWRWLLNRRDTPWYPTATLYRQPAPGDWNSVVTEVAKDLVVLC